MNRLYLLYAVLLLVGATIVSAWCSGRRMFVSIAAGWLLGLVNYALLRWSIRRLIAGQRHQMFIASLNMMRLGLVFIALIVVLSLNMADVTGIFIGFALINVVIMIDGYINRRGLEQG
ncbi:MAG: ATP synthase subunit I [Candidatus Magnetobacterium sp. LHC-1]|uniref:ATP synthase subunit I n=1 Tax=Candidatus Magnetobacterium casense TaxID=1455061 RepID=A0ABS6S213_9BACT|nr:ATP synthase subunit I [Candidatus Magnetobacterium casensis]MBF0608361.1 ATP synthase subunit I [Nitrospirota bacterium]MBV6342885.1 ATP synthase subunit I [Candidatus Magnetobacterium casensis]